MQPLPPEEARRDGAEDAQWSRPECQVWTGTLLLGTCLLYCARVSMPVCTVSMSQDFGWNKKEAGIVLSSFFWGYCLTQDRGREGHPAVRLRLGLHHCRHPAARPPQQRPPGLHDLLSHPHRLAPRGVLPGADQPPVPEGARERARLHLQRRGGWLPVRDAGDGGRGLPAPGLVRLAERLLLLRRAHPAVGVLRVQVPAHWKRAHPGLGRSGARPAGVQAHQGSLETALPEAFRLGSHLLPAVIRVLLLHPPLLAAHLLSGDIPQLQGSHEGLGLQETVLVDLGLVGTVRGWVFNVVPWLVAIPASLFSGFLSDHLINQGYRTIAVRKFMQVMGLGLSSVFALCLGHTSSFCKSVVFASASIGLQTFNHSGISVNIQDLAPSCAGFLFGVANTAGALAGVVGVCLGGYLIETTGSWTSMFNLVAAISGLGLCTFLLFGEAQRVDLSPTHEDL